KGLINRLLARHSCEELFNSRRLVKQKALHNSEAGHPVPLCSIAYSMDPSLRSLLSGIFADDLLPSPSGRGARGEGSDLPRHFAPLEPSPGCRHPLPKGEGLTSQRLREFKSLGFVVQSDSLGCLESANWDFGYCGQR